MSAQNSIKRETLRFRRLHKAGFVRTLSNPAFSPNSVSVQEATAGLMESLRDEMHQFWPDSILFPNAMRLLGQPLKGHQQVRDAYFVALAIHKKGKLATLDRKIQQWAPAGSVEVIA